MDIVFRHHALFCDFGAYGAHTSIIKNAILQSMILFSILFVFCFGLAIGSFLNAYIYRLHAGKSVFRGRSFCPLCKKTLLAKDLLPLISFALLKGKCRFCRKEISWQYPLVEAAVALLFVLGYLRFIGNPFAETTLLADLAGFVSFLCAVAIFIVIFVYDLKYYLILDKVTVPSFFVFLFFDVLLVILKGGAMHGFARGVLLPVLLYLAAGVVGGGFFAIQFLVSGGKWIGGGDIRLGVLMGMALGLKHLLIALFLAYVLGSVISLCLIAIKKKKFNSQIPFAVFLVPATLATLLYGDLIAAWYIGFFAL